MHDPRADADALKEHLRNPLWFPVRVGVVVDVDTSTNPGLVRVELQPEGAVLPWMKIRPMKFIAGGWAMLAMPAVGSDVLLLATDPDCKGFRYLCEVFNDDDTAPAVAAAGQVLCQHEGSGNQLLLDADGMVYLGAKAGAQPLVQQPWVTDTFNTHTHPHPLGPTSVPTTPWTAGDMTTKCKGA